MLATKLTTQRTSTSNNGIITTNHFQRSKPSIRQHKHTILLKRAQQITEEEWNHNQNKKQETPEYDTITCRN